MPSMTPAESIAQLAAQYAYACGTCEDYAITQYQSPVYTAADAAYRAAMRQAFGLSDAELDEAREILAGYGPFDGSYGTGAPSDVRGHAVQARLNVAEHRALAAEQLAVQASPWRNGDEEQPYEISYQGKAVHTAYLCAAQVGHMFAHLPGTDWSVRPVSYTVPAACDEDLADLRAQLAV